MKSCPCYPQIDPGFAKAIMVGFENALFRRYLKFYRMKAWNFIFFKIPHKIERCVDIPSGWCDYDEEHKKFYRECIRLLNKGWHNDVAERWYPKILRDIGVFDE